MLKIKLADGTTKTLLIGIQPHFYSCCITVTELTIMQIPHNQQSTFASSLVTRFSSRTEKSMEFNTTKVLIYFKLNVLLLVCEANLEYYRDRNKLVRPQQILGRTRSEWGVYFNLQKEILRWRWFHFFRRSCQYSLVVHGGTELLLLLLLLATGIESYIKCRHTQQLWQEHTHALYKRQLFLLLSNANLNFVTTIQINITMALWSMFMERWGNRQHKLIITCRLEKFIPPAFLKTKNLEQSIFKEHKKLSGMTEVNAKFRYVQLCRSLKTYGMSVFKIQVCSIPSICLVKQSFNLCSDAQGILQIKQEVCR